MTGLWRGPSVNGTGSAYRAAEVGLFFRRFNGASVGPSGCVLGCSVIPYVLTHALIKWSSRIGPCFALNELYSLVFLRWHRGPRSLSSPAVLLPHAGGRRLSTAPLEVKRSLQSAGDLHYWTSYDSFPYDHHDESMHLYSPGANYCRKTFCTQTFVTWLSVTGWKKQNAFSVISVIICLWLPVQWLITSLSVCDNFPRSFFIFLSVGNFCPQR